MNRTLNKTRLNSLLEQLAKTHVSEITSFDDIPQFDNAEDEVRFWRSHTLSEEMLDQISDLLDDQE